MIDLARYSAPVADVAARFLEALRPSTRLTISQFADAELVVTSGPLAGTKWRTDTAPYQRGILDAFLEPGVEFVIVCSSAQVGKTSLTLAVVAYHVVHDPCSILVIAPTVQPMAQDWSKNRLEPLIAASPALAGVFAKRRAKDASNTVLAKTFRGGSLSIGGANSAAGLASRTIRLLILDEVDRYPTEQRGEGSTISIALKRTATFLGSRRIFMVSTPTQKDAPIDTWHRRGDQRVFEVPCPACGSLFAFEWAQVRWINGDPSTALIHCPHCDHGLDDPARADALRAGAWTPTQPDRPETNIVSFHLWEAMSPFARLSEIVATFLRARAAQLAGDRSELHTFINTALGQVVDDVEKGDGLDAEALLERREPFDADVPAGACVLTAGIDVQDDRLEVLVIAWGPSEECWIVDRRTCDGDTSQSAPWSALDAVLDRRYRHASGPLLGIAAACIDSGGHRTGEVYAYGQRRAARGLYVIKGDSGARAIIEKASPIQKGAGGRRVKLFPVGVDSAKALIMGRLRVEAGPGAIHFPDADWIDRAFFDELTSERQFKRYTKGRAVLEWRKIRTRNEALDCFVYAIAALRIWRPSFEQAAAHLAAEAAALTHATPTSAPHVPTAQAARPWIAPRRDWFRGSRV